jgi:hypothetical protein
MAAFEVATEARTIAVSEADENLEPKSLLASNIWNRSKKQVVRVASLKGVGSDSDSDSALAGWRPIHKY